MGQSTTVWHPSNLNSSWEAESRSWHAWRALCHAKCVSIVGKCDDIGMAKWRHFAVQCLDKSRTRNRPFTPNLGQSHAPTVPTTRQFLDAARQAGGTTGPSQQGFRQRAGHGHARALPIHCPNSARLHSTSIDSRALTERAIRIISSVISRRWCARSRPA